MNPVGWQIRPATEEDLPALLSISAGAAADAWTAGALLSELRLTWSHVDALTPANLNASPCGFIVYWHVAAELELLNICVASSQRRQGLGGCLMEHLVGRAKALQCDAMHLEVRRSNTAAIKLYRRFGFKVVGIRRGYYSKDGEDALLFRWDT